MEDAKKTECDEAKAFLASVTQTKTSIEKPENATMSNIPPSL